ncbi:MAG TPA: hypothetical protein VJ486_01495 [Geothrix sp.]|nr:hypothetical protein [Geothrix sp.]
MGRLVLWVLTLVLPFQPAWTRDPPSPLFYESEARFLEQVESGSFDPHLELHLLEYAADPRWVLDWVSNRYAKGGLFAEYGSTTSSRLFVNSQLALNLFPAERLQFRYDRRTYQDSRFELQDERFDFLWHPGGSWGLIASGWPSSRKDRASLGAGIRLGSRDGGQELALLVMNDRPFWNEKTDESIQFNQAPYRLLLDGHGRHAAWRYGGSVDFGMPYRAQDLGVGPIKTIRGYQRLGDLGAEYQAESWAAGARFSWGDLLREQGEEGTPTYWLERRYKRILTYARTLRGLFAWYAWLGLAHQQDSFASPSIQAGSYHMAARLFGVELGVFPRQKLEIRLGYLGNDMGMERRSLPIGGADLPLPDRTENRFVDKVHCRLLWTFSPRMSLEFLLSHTLAGDRFGGGSLKVRFIL